MPTRHSLADLVRMVASRFREDSCIETASNLTFTTLLALVPVATVILTIASAFPRSEMLIEPLKAFIIHNLLPESVQVISTYAEQFFRNATGLTLLGVAVLAVTALLLMLTIDHAFNRIWAVSRPRPLLQRVLVYWTVLTIGPLFIGASLSLTTYLLTAPLGLPVAASGAAAALLRILPLAFSATALAFIYLYVPNRAVLKSDAVIGGIGAGLAFEVMKQGFGAYIAHFSSYTLVYGAFAAVPIFLIWIYVSWVVILGGAVLVATLPEWRAGATRAARAAGSDFYDALQVLNALWDAHRRGDVVSLAQLQSALGLPMRVLDAVLERLEQAAWVARIGTGAWVLSRDAGAIRLADVYSLYVFSAAACVQAAGCDPQLDERLQDLATGVTAHMQTSLEDLFSGPASGVQAQS